MMMIKKLTPLIMPQPPKMSTRKENFPVYITQDYDLKDKCRDEINPKLSGPVDKMLKSKLSK